MAGDERRDALLLRWPSIWLRNTNLAPPEWAEYWVLAMTIASTPMLLPEAEVRLFELARRVRRQTMPCALRNVTLGTSKSARRGLDLALCRLA